MTSYVDTFKRFLQRGQALFYEKNRLLHVCRSVYFTISIGKNNQNCFRFVMAFIIHFRFLGASGFRQIRVFTKSKHSPQSTHMVCARNYIHSEIIFIFIMHYIILGILQNLTLKMQEIASEGL